MARKYTQIELLKDEILRLRRENITTTEIAKTLGLEKKQITNFITRHNRKERKIQAGIILRGKGRPPKDLADSKVNRDLEKDYEINRLRMENKLLRDFHQIAGRG